MEPESFRSFRHPPAIPAGRHRKPALGVKRLQNTGEITKDLLRKTGRVLRFEPGQREVQLEYRL